MHLKVFVMLFNEHFESFWKLSKLLIFVWLFKHKIFLLLLEDETTFETFIVKPSTTVFNLMRRRQTEIITVLIIL